MRRGAKRVRSDGEARHVTPRICDVGHDWPVKHRRRVLRHAESGSSQHIRIAPRVTASVAVLLIGLVSGVALSTGGAVAAGQASAATTTVEAPVLALHAVRGTNPGIFDSAGRQVTLRGVNVDELGDYYQGNTALPTVIPLGDTDFATMAAQGFDAIRLLVSWSKLEPTRGTFDASYVSHIRAVVATAAAHGMYSVIDMHQDAYGKYVATPPGVACPAGTNTAIGWDGAPEWATLSDGASTCVADGDSRESSEAVMTAWDSFYANTNGIRDEFNDTWRMLAAAFATNPAVAGFDLLNEPGYGHDAGASAAGIAATFQGAVAAIRTGEQGSGGFAHPIFFEYGVNGAAVPAAFSNDSGLVFAPHVYAESITPIPLSVNFAYVESLAKGYGTAIWIGEYGWFSDPVTNAPKVAAFAQLEDQNLAGSAWWQWRQACGDPHSIGVQGGTPASTIIQYNRETCPGDRNEGPISQWQTVLSRPYLRAAPGRLVTVKSDGAARTYAAIATAATVGGSVDLWVPAHGGTAPIVGGTGVAAVAVRPVTGGFRVSMTVCGSSYSVAVGPGATAPAACAAGSVPGAAAASAPAAIPVAENPTFTG